MTQRTDVIVTTPGGRCPSVVVEPDGTGPWPAVIMFMDAAGVRPAMVEMAERLAALGYVVLLPEMYHRSGDYEPFDPAVAFTDPEERARIGKLAGALTPDMVAEDAGAFLDSLTGLDSVAGTKVGCVGYCLGGAMALRAAAHHPDRIAAAASIHGGRLASEADDSPHRLVDRIAGRVYVAMATDDPSFPPDQQERLEAALTDAGVEHTMETYPAGHGFAVPDNAPYDPEAADRHWRALGDLFGATLHD